MDRPQDNRQTPYNMVIGPDYLEENVYPQGFPALIILHTDPAEKTKPHWHRGLEVVYADRGETSFWVDDRLHRIEQGGVLLISPYSIHHGCSGEGITPRALSITFNHDALRPVYPFADRYLFDINSPQATRTDREQLVTLAKQALRRYEAGGLERAFLLNATLYDMLHLLYTRFTVGTRRPELTRDGRNLAMQMTGYVDAHHAEPLTAAQTAADFGYSREHFSRLFRKATGMSFKAFLTGVRLEDARERLEHSSASLSQIAKESGFPNQRALHSAFLECYGVAPREYRYTTAAGMSGSNRTAV